MRNLTILIAFILLFTSCQEKKGQSTGKNNFAKIKDTKILKVGYIIFPPCISKDLKTNKLHGHFISTIEQIAMESGWKIEYIESDWATFVAGLESNRFDICIAPTFVTIPRSLSVSFTQPLFYAGNSAIIKKGENRFTTIQSLDQKGVTIAVTAGEAGSEYTKANFKNITVISSQGSDQSLAFQNVISGRADVALGDAYATSEFAKTHSKEVADLFGKNPYNLTPVSWTVGSQDSDLLQFLNNSLDVLETRGLLKQYEKDADAHWLHIKKDFILE